MASLPAQIRLLIKRVFQLFENACIPNNLVCDNKTDCNLGEDEEKCYGLEILNPPFSKNIGLLSQTILGEVVPVCMKNRPTRTFVDGLCKKKKMVSIMQSVIT
ncbi:uncharacterized protein LOC112127299 [Cimex lectularius]|uniref:Uncharacterized protein n=1 Tax=Cimex lectularius TaxID=79782 RepID=A0A8I6SL93_CIMLE|nr:uncharacterized protein LOC112127299 [Cimex lectularius]